MRLIVIVECKELYKMLELGTEYNINGNDLVTAIIEDSYCKLYSDDGARLIAKKYNNYNIWNIAEHVLNCDICSKKYRISL